MQSQRINRFDKFEMYRETFYVQGKRKKESDTTISCNLNGLKASFGFWAVTEKEGVETLFGSFG